MGQRRLLCDAQLLRCVLTGCRRSLIRYQAVCTHSFSLRLISGLEMKKCLPKQKRSWIPFSFPWDVPDLKLCLAAELPVTAGFWARWVSHVPDGKPEFLLRAELRAAEALQFNALWCIYSISIWRDIPAWFYTFWCLKLPNSSYILFATSAFCQLSFWFA